MALSVGGKISTWPENMLELQNLSYFHQASLSAAKPDELVVIN